MPRDDLSMHRRYPTYARAVGIVALSVAMVSIGGGVAWAATTPPEVVPSVPEPLGDFPDELFVYNGDLYYPTPGAANSVLARFDGTTASVYDTDDDAANPSNLTEFQGALFMSAGLAGDVSLASFTTAGGFQGYPTAPDGVGELEVSGGVLYFAADPGGVLYSFDGTTVAPVAGSPTAISDVVAFEGALFLAGDVAGVRSIWSYDPFGGF